MIKKLGIIGAGAMGTGIAQVAALSGLEVLVFDSNQEASNRGLQMIQAQINKGVEKHKISPEQGVEVMGRLLFCEKMESLAECDLIIEAIVENIEIKKKVFQSLEKIVSKDCILATNTSSLSVTALAASLTNSDRFIGIHFFNPAHIMPLVEIVPAIQTIDSITTKVIQEVESWQKICVTAKDTPGFIVNKVARPFYSEALRIYEEGIANIPTIDWIMTNMGGFKMGPFTLMDFIGHDVNYTVTETVWKSFYYDGKYKPALSQLKLIEAGFLGKKSGRGFYDYSKDISIYEELINNDVEGGQIILDRILAMLINEAADTIYQGICNIQDVEIAMTKGVNYPKGLMKWGEDIGYDNVIDILDKLYEYYHEERYRVCPLLKKLGKI